MLFRWGAQNVEESVDWLRQSAFLSGKSVTAVFRRFFLSRWLKFLLQESLQLSTVGRGTSFRPTFLFRLSPLNSTSQDGGVSSPDTLYTSLVTPTSSRTPLATVPEQAYVNTQRFPQKRIRQSSISSSKNRNYFPLVSVKIELSLFCTVFKPRNFRRARKRESLDSRSIKDWFSNC